MRIEVGQTVAVIYENGLNEAKPTTENIFGVVRTVMRVRESYTSYEVEMYDGSLYKGPRVVALPKWYSR